MALAVEDRDSHVLHRETCKRPARDDLKDALFHRGHELAWNGATLDGIDELEPRAPWQWLHMQHHFAELPGAAGLLLVAIMPLRPDADGLPIGDLRWSRHDFELVLLGQSLQHDAQVQLAQASHHGLVGADRVFDAQARVFRAQLLQNLPQALLVAPARGLDRQTIDGRGKVERGQVDVAVLGRVVQHGIEADLVDLGRGADIAWAGLGNIHVLLALQHHQVRDFERLAPVTDIKLAIAPDRALMDAKHDHLADVRVHDDLEGVRQYMLVGNRFGAYDFLAAAGIAVEERRVALHGIGQEPDEHVE